jgi:hypothetical protein
MPRLAVASVLVLTACSPGKSKKANEGSSAPPAAAARAPAAASDGKAAKHAVRLPTLSPVRFSLAIAESENTPAAWSAVADGYDKQLATCTVECRDIAYQAVLARKQAVKTANLAKPAGEDWTPVAMPPEVRAALDATDLLIALLDPSDDELAPLKFLSASSLYRYRQDDAIARLEEILRDYRYGPTAEYAANQLLDALMRSNNTDKLRTWVTELSTDETFLADKPQLRQTLQQIQQALAG